MNLAGYAIRRNTVMLLSMMLLAFGGGFSYMKLGCLEDPEFTIKEAVIYTQYPGATAAEVELEVTDPLETAIQQLKSLKEVRSISRAGLSIIFAEIQETYDKETLPQVWDELRRKVNAAAATLPSGALAPSVNDDFGDVYGVLFAITGDGQSPHDLYEIAKDLRKELLLCRDVGRIDFWGVQPEVIYVEMDRVKLARLGITPSTIFNTLRQQNAVTFAGEVQVGSAQVPLRVTGDFTKPEDIEELLIRGGTENRMVRLKDVAKVERGYQDPSTELLRWNGQPAVALGISTVSGGNVIMMGDSIRARLAQLEKHFPVGVEIHPIADQAETTKTAVRGFALNLAESVAIVVLLLLFFMGLREGVIIGAVLLLTIFGTFLCMYAMDISLHRISLGALIIALGMLVDNAIVIVEGIVVRSRRGMTRLIAAETTVREMQWPLLGATGIAILAFAAITLSKDMTGEWLQSLFQVICISLGLSWLLAITVAPYLCVKFLPTDGSTKTAPYHNRFYRTYRWLLKCGLNHRWLSLACVLGILFLAMWGFGHVKQDFMPDMNRPQFTVDFWLPEGTRIEQTADQVAVVEKFVGQLEGVTDVASFIGRGPLRFLLTFEPEMPSSAYGQLLVSVDSYDQIPSLMSKTSAYLKQKHPDAVSSVDSFKLGPGGGAVVARLSGSNIATLRKLAKNVRVTMQNHPNTRSDRTDWGELVKTETIPMARPRSHAIGVTRPEIAQALAMNFTGAVVGQYRKEEDLLPIMLRPPFEQRHGIQNVNNIQVWSQVQNHWIPLGQIADDPMMKWEDPVIRRLNRIRTLSVSCKPTTGTTEDLFKQLRKPIESLELPEGYKLEWGGEHEEHEEANRKLLSNVPVAFLAMLFISVILFNSFRHSLIIFLGLPLATIGVAAGMLLSGKPFGFMAMLGLLSLSGMLIKNTIVVLDQIKLESKNNTTPFDAIVDAAVICVRPITMAAFTTVFGMTTLLWDAFFSPMAVTIMGGLSVSTVLTLIVTPILYATIFKIHRQHSLSSPKG